MKVTVFGCGPAGLIAAHAVRMRDPEADIRILSRRIKSELYGAQYLHQVPEGIPQLRHTIIDYQLRGDPEGYRRKVYGSMWDGKVSPEDLVGRHDAWDIRQAYDWLWSEYSHLIVHCHNVEPWLVSRALMVSDLVINSIPRSVLCTRGHSFGAMEIVAAGEAPEIGIRLPYSCPESVVLCNGEDNPSWYRLSRVFGRTTVEWPSDIGRVPIASAATVQKPTYTNCDCWPEVTHVGRYGRWEKGVLTHHSYTTVQGAMTVREMHS